MNYPDHMQLTAFTVTTGDEWKVPCLTASFPRAWLNRLTRLYQHAHKGWSLPTRSLGDLLMAVDPAVIHVGWNLTSPHAIVAFPGVNPQSLAIAIAAWASTEVCPNHPADDDWWDFFDSTHLDFQPHTFNVLEHSARGNGTAAPAAAMFNLLPSLLAQHVKAQGLSLLAKPRDLILGPPQLKRRSLVMLPFEEISGAGGGIATTKVTFHVQTAPNHPQPHIHADLTTSRAPLQPVTYVPARGDGPASATVWLYAPDGFVHAHEPHSLLAAAAEQRWLKGGGRAWQWTPGLITALGRLSHLPFPAPEKIFADPRIARDEGKIRAYVLYSEGSRSQADDLDELDDYVVGDQAPKARSLRHAAKTGLVPADHMEVFEQLTPVLQEVGIVPITPARRVGKKVYRLLKATDHSGQTYTIELWTETADTKEAIQTALQHELGLQPAPDPVNPGVIHYRGDINISLVLKEVGILGAGIDRAGDHPRSTKLGLHASMVERQIGASTQPVAAIFELRGPEFFSKAQLIDPKKALKKAFGRSGRRLQCMRPAVPFKPPTKPPKNPAKVRTPYPGTKLAQGSVHRAKASILDALRQLGRIGTYQTPAGLPDLEQIGIELHHDGNTCIPIVVRIPVTGDPIAHLASADGNPMPPILYRDLPQALASGKGRIRQGEKQKDHVAHFLINVLGVGSTTIRDTHDRVVYVRAAGFRNWGWDWLQDKNIHPQQLTLPGQIFDEDTAPLAFLTPEQCPGLRIIRVRDRSSTGEVAMGFAKNHTTESPRINGLFTFNDRVFYSINPRSAQNQTPLSVTKLDPGKSRNFTFRAANPTALEIYPVFLQSGDDREGYALLASRLRRTYLHTDQATLFPAALHLCQLASEYL